MIAVWSYLHEQEYYFNLINTFVFCAIKSLMLIVQGTYYRKVLTLKSHRICLVILVRTTFRTKAITEQHFLVLHLLIIENEERICLVVNRHFEDPEDVTF